jgi:hypothetical protein
MVSDKQERKKQATPEFKDFYSERTDGERVISHLTRHGGRQARYIGAFKVWCQEVLTALNHNIKAFYRLAARCCRGGPPAESDK